MLHSDVSTSVRLSANKNGHKPEPTEHFAKNDARPVPPLYWMADIKLANGRKNSVNRSIVVVALFIGLGTKVIPSAQHSQKERAEKQRYLETQKAYKI